MSEKEKDQKEVEETKVPQNILEKLHDSIEHIRYDGMPLFASNAYYYSSYPPTVKDLIDTFPEYEKLIEDHLRTIREAMAELDLSQAQGKPHSSLLFQKIVRDIKAKGRGKSQNFVLGLYTAFCDQYYLSPVEQAELREALLKEGLIWGNAPKEETEKLVEVKPDNSSLLDFLIEKYVEVAKLGGDRHWIYHSLCRENNLSYQDRLVFRKKLDKADYADMPPDGDIINAAASRTMGETTEQAFERLERERKEHVVVLKEESQVGLLKSEVNARSEAIMNSPSFASLKEAILREAIDMEAEKAFAAIDIPDVKNRNETIMEADAANIAHITSLIKGALKASSAPKEMITQLFDLLSKVDEAVSKEEIEAAKDKPSIDKSQYYTGGAGTLSEVKETSPSSSNAWWLLLTALAGAGLASATKTTDVLDKVIEITGEKVQ